MRPSLLIIGHVEATGRHGMAADLRAAQELGTEPLPVVTSFSTGDPLAPARLSPVSGNQLSAQLAAALDREPNAALIGVLSRPRQARLIARQLAERGPAAIVLAPLPSAFDLMPLVNRRLPI